MGKPGQNDAEQNKKLGKKKFKKHKGKPFLNRRKSKQILKEKRARLVIKNLPFIATEENIRQHFGQYGDILSVDILKRPDGKLVGCAFVQFKLVQFAQKAKHYTNNQPFFGRNITVDFAKAKEKYDKEKASVKTEVKTEDGVEIMKQETEDVEIKDEKQSEDSKEESDSEVNSENDDNEVEETDSQISEDTHQKQSFQSHDVNERKTNFLKNVPFQATNQDIKEYTSQFGRLYYALVVDKLLTEHFKETAFVKFANQEDAEKALKAELTLMGNILDFHAAIDQNDLKNKDSRNLHLLKEGVILAGTKSAEGVSASDMAKRLQIEHYKIQMLRNLNTFVARNRLIVHNLSVTWDDTKLKVLFQKHGGSGAVVREARIMTDLRKLDAKYVGESRQFGFVAFTTHEHALAALRSLNNNPNVFSPHKRPIITFSIESKSAVKIKIKRQEEI